MSYEYILRYTLQPGFHEDDRLEKLVAFCKEALIDDVMIFINGEELNSGHLTIEETTPWLEMIARAKSLLAEHGVTTSINPWPSLLGLDRGRTLRPGQNFTTMVDPYGLQSSAQACPLCPEWRKYIAEIYAYYATVKPSMVWVEDDFRFHNHAPLEWGGCFCDLHMAEFSKRAGRQITRVEFVQGLLQPGDPHPFRAIWLDSARETMVEVARLIGDAVHQVSPSTWVGLMSSSPEIHCAEGRDWAGILGGLSGDGVPMVNRPHLPAYCERTGLDYLSRFAEVSMLSMASVPAETEMYPELESSPYTSFIKSATFTRHQIATTAAMGAKGITFNIFDMIGSGIVQPEKLQAALSGVKPYMESVTPLGMGKSSQKGVAVLTNSKSSYTLHTSDVSSVEELPPRQRSTLWPNSMQTPEGRSMEELFPTETFWASLLSLFGIANRYVVDGLPSGEVVAISGQYFRNLSESDLRELLSTNSVILDGEAAFTLFDMGYGEIAGIKNAVWHKLNSGFASYEQVCNGGIYCSVEETRISSQVAAGDFLEIEYFGKPDLKTVIKNPADQAVASGVTVVDGRIFILPYGRFGGDFSRHLHPLRQELLQEWLSGLGAKETVFFAKQSEPLGLYAYDLNEKMAVFVINASADSVDGIILHGPGLVAHNVLRWSESGDCLPVKAINDGDDITVSLRLASLETTTLLFAKG